MHLEVRGYFDKGHGGRETGRRGGEEELLIAFAVIYMFL